MARPCCHGMVTAWRAVGLSSLCRLSVRVQLVCCTWSQVWQTCIEAFSRHALLQTASLFPHHPRVVGAHGRLEPLLVVSPLIVRYVCSSHRVIYGSEVEVCTKVLSMPTCLGSIPMIVLIDKARWCNS